VVASLENMSELPKIALARLKAKADRPKPAGASAGPPAFGESAHPDANLIAAFAERGLSDREQTQVLNHLNQCADCRAVAAFMVPAATAEEQPVRNKAVVRWNPWPMLRWGALAGVLGILAIVVVSHPDLWRHDQKLAKVTSPPAPAGNVEKAPTAVAPLPSTPPPAKDAELDARLRTREPASERVRLKKESAAQLDLAKRDRVAALPAKQHATMMASVRPPVELREANAPAVGMGRRESLGDEARSVAVASPALSTPAAPAAGPTAASEQAGKATAESNRSTAPQNVTQSVTVSADSEVVVVTSPSTTATGGAPGAAPSQTSAAKTAPRGATQGNMQGLARGSQFGIGAFSKEMKLKAGAAADLWRVATDGNVQHSVDGAKSFQTIEIVHGVKFQSVAANGNDVWAGGDNGTLYHSLDAGATWKPIAINVEGNAMTETIAAIQLHSPQRVIILTASGSAWVSEDGGVHWRKQP
jgi:hypothetical protein